MSDETIQQTDPTEPEFGLSLMTNPPGNKLPWLTANVR